MREPLDIEIEDGIATLTLNRPASRNALNRDMADALLAALTDVGRDAAVRCVVVAGAGESFCSGGDVKMFAEVMGADRATRESHFQGFAGHVHQLITALRDLPKPSLASARGAVAGFGVSLTMACDMAIASDTAFFTLAYARMGLSPDGGSTYFLPRLVGERRAKELALLADRIDAQTALRFGLINKLIADDRLDAETATLAAQLAGGPTRAYANAKALFDATWSSTLEAQLAAEAVGLGRSAATADFEEAVAAFIAKRRPCFKGE